MLKLFARMEPTTDDVARQHMSPKSFAKKRDVAIYDDRECTKPKCRFMWYVSRKPRRFAPNATINCYKWELEWLPELKEEP